MQKDLDPAVPDHDSDWEGNNAAFTCPNCKKVFIVSGRIHHGTRPCPQCGRSTATIIGGKKNGGSALINY